MAAQKNFGQYLKIKRLDAGLTQFEAAKALGNFSPQYISNIERDCSFPPNKILRNMVKLYKIPVDEILNLLVEMDTRRWKKTLTGTR
jgi:transcriptional regulator with XRE-family HTH domain